MSQHSVDETGRARDFDVLVEQQKLGPDALDLERERRVDPQRMPASWLRQRREPGAPCPRCDGQIAKTGIGGRSTYRCPECQS